MKLEKNRENIYEEVTNENLYDIFAKNMQLTIKKGTALVFTNTIFNKSFYEMLYDKDNEEYNGYDLSSLDSFNIGRNKYIDLEYTVHMDENAGNELQGIKATVDFLINAQENPDQNSDDDDDDDDDDIKDINNDHWAHDCIKTLLKHGIIKGYPDGTIRPENYITRAEAAVLVGRALELEEIDKLLDGYLDNIPKWSRGYILVTTEKGIFKGYPGKLFKANDNIIREEMAAVLFRAFDRQLDGDLKIEFLDKDKISNWALEHVKCGVQHDIIVGYPDSTFRPKGCITRAEAFTMICKLLGYHEEHE